MNRPYAEPFRSVRTHEAPDRVTVPTGAGAIRDDDDDSDPAASVSLTAPPGPPSTATGRTAPGWRQHVSFWLVGAAVVGTALVAWALLSELALLLGLLAVALFFTIVLTPFVDRVQARLHVRRTVATLLVFVIGTVVVGGIVLLFVQPIASSSSDLGRDLPKLVRDAEHGRGRIGHVLRDLGVQGWVHDNLPAIRKSLGRSDGPLFRAGVAVVSGVVATITIMVLVFLMLVEGPIFSAAVLDLFPPTRAARLRRVGTDAARAMSGYAFGNLAISGLAGLSAYAALRLLGVPFALVLAVWVAFADLIPLVGATLGAIPPVFVGLLKSPGTAIAAIAFFVVYQLFENHVVQPVVMSRTVRLNPLGVLLVVIAGVELAGMLGALLALPVAGALKVVVEDVWSNQRPHVEEVLAHDAEAVVDPDAPTASRPRRYPVMVFIVQHTQARLEIATQRKLDELLRALPDADNRLIAAEVASDAELADIGEQHLDVRRSVLEHSGDDRDHP